MRQLVRFFLSPAIFINQLQWSRNHGRILLTFLAVALLESQIGVGRALNEQLAWVLNDLTGIERDQSLWLVTGARVLLLFFGALSLSETLWWVGAKLGTPASKRVLYRRMAVVLTLLLGSYTFFAVEGNVAQSISGIAFAWGLILGYLTLREQFALDRATAAAFGLGTVLAVLISWQITDTLIETVASQAIANKELVRHTQPRH